MTAFESALLTWYRSNSNPEVRRHMEGCSVRSVEYTGHGMFITLNPDSHQTPSPDVRVTDGPEITSPEIPHGAGSILFFANGRPDFVEAFAYAAPFPVGGPSDFKFDPDE